MKDWLLDLVARALAGLGLERLVARAPYVRKRVSKYLFLWDAREFLEANGIRGDYYEFGLYKCGTFLKALGILNSRVDFYYGFDSFQGLPPLAEGDAHHDWEAGAMKSPAGAETYQQLIESRFPQMRGRFRLVEGFFEESLPKFRCTGNKAAVIFLDCDLTSSTRTVLRFVKERELLQDGTLLFFDDYFAYKGNPGRGSQKAFREFLAEVPGHSFPE